MPTSQYIFITSLQYLKPETPLGANWGIVGDLKISNSLSVANRLITTTLQDRIGQLEINRILSGDPFVYAIASFPLEGASEESQMSVLFTYLAHTQQFMNMLWLVKDNSVNFDLGFLQYPFTTELSMVRVSSNSMSPIFSKADGKRSQVAFTTAELKEAITYYDLFLGGQEFKILNPESPLGPLGETTRLSRALYFLQAARAAWYLPEKVAYYCTCFESIVSTNPTELAHQVAERVASLIGEDPSHSVEVYRNLKRAYGTRSKLVHGSKLTDATDRYLTDSTNCDTYLRRLIHVLIAEQPVRNAIEQNAEKVDQFFLENIFRETKP